MKLEAMRRQLQTTLQSADLTTLFRGDAALRIGWLESKGLVLPDGHATPHDELDKYLHANLSPSEIEALDAAIVARHVQALAERDTPPGAVDAAALKRLLEEHATQDERQ